MYFSLVCYEQFKWLLCISASYRWRSQKSKWTNQRAVSSSPDHSGPIRGAGHAQGSVTRTRSWSQPDSGANSSIEIICVTALHRAQTHSYLLLPP